MTDDDEATWITEAIAARLVGQLEARGAVFTWRADETFLCDLNRAGIATRDEAEAFATVLLAFADQINAVLRDRHGVIH